MDEEITPTLFNPPLFRSVPAGPAVARKEGQHRGLHGRHGQHRLALRRRPRGRRDRGTGPSLRPSVPNRRRRQRCSRQRVGGGVCVAVYFSAAMLLSYVVYAYNTYTRIAFDNCWSAVH